MNLRTMEHFTETPTHRLWLTLSMLYFVSIFTTASSVSLLALTPGALTSDPQQHDLDLLAQSNPAAWGLPSPLPREEETESDGGIKCIRHHEYAVFVLPNEVQNFYSNENRMTSLRSYVNGNGKVKHYFCRPCSTCGEGVRILSQCHLKQDIVCSNVCINPTLIYDHALQRCFDLVTRARLDKETENTTHSDVILTVTQISQIVSNGFRYITSNIDDGLNDAEREPTQKKSNKWMKEIIPVTVGVLTLNIMLAILLVWKRREWQKKKAAQRLIQQTTERQNQNNRCETSTSEHESQARHSQVIVDIESQTSSSTNATESADVNVFTSSSRRIKESNLNHYVENLQLADAPSPTTEFMQSHITIEPTINAIPGTSPYWLEMSGVFGPRGGELSCDESDVVVQIPSGAIPTSHPQQLIVVKVSRALEHFPLALSKEAMFLSPLVDCESPGLKRFNRDVIIKLPHRAKLSPDWKFTVHYTDGSATNNTTWNAMTGTSNQERQNKPLRVTSRNVSATSDASFTLDDKYVNINTPHFSRYTCSGCGGKKRELSLEAVVYVKDTKLHDTGRRIDLHAYILDSIKDFQSKVNLNETNRPHSEHMPLVVDVKKANTLQISLVDMGEDWPWRVDEHIHKTVQVVSLTEVVRCHSDAAPYYATFILRPKHQESLTETKQQHLITKISLEAAVCINQVTPKKVTKGVTVDIALNLDEHEQNQRTEEVGSTDENVLQDVFTFLSGKIPVREWRPLYRCLMTTSSGCPVNIEADISFIENKDPQDFKEQIYQGFIKWLSISGKNATLQKLCNSLRQVEMVKLAEDVEKQLEKAFKQHSVASIGNAESSLNIDQEQNAFHVLETA